MQEFGLGDAGHPNHSFFWTANPEEDIFRLTEDIYRVQNLHGHPGSAPNGLRYLGVVGVDKVWEQEKLEARTRLVNRADSHTSGARWVRLPSSQFSVSGSAASKIKESEPELLLRKVLEKLLHRLLYDFPRAST